MSMDIPLIKFLHSLAHYWGMATSIYLVYVGNRIRKEYGGGVIGKTGSYIIVGSLAFFLGFLNMELNMGLGISTLGRFLPMQIDMAVDMGLFNVMIIMLGYAYYKTSEVMT